MEICPAVAANVASEATRNILMLAGLMTALISVAIVLSTAKKKQTADLLFGCRLDEHLKIGMQRISTLHDANGSIKDLLKPENESSEDAQAVKAVLNHWERIAVGIIQGIYHEEMLRQSNRSNVISLYKKAKPYIDAVRHQTGTPTFFQQFERMAISWEGRPLKPLKTWRWLRD